MSLLVVAAFAAIDSASAVNGIQTVGGLIQIIEKLTGNTAWTGLTTGVFSLLALIAGAIIHNHGHTAGVNSVTYGQSVKPPSDSINPGDVTG